MERAIALTLLLLLAATLNVRAAGPELAIAPDVEERLARFAAVNLTASLAAVPQEEHPVLEHLLAAAKQMDEIFLRQVWAGNPELLGRLNAASGPPTGTARAYFDVNFGPWDRLDDLEPFIGDRPHPAGAGFYPEDLAKDEFEAWIAAHPEDKESLTSLTTVVKREEGRLVAIPYSTEYGPWLDEAASHLRQAAAATRNASLKRFLELRAAAFLSDDYYASDVAWMDLDSPVEVTIGPYETYEDGLFGYKAAFEAFVTVALEQESADLARFKHELPWLERNLPIPDQHKNLERGSESPIRVVDVVFSAGDTKAGVQTIAFNLPNDERVREAKGSKKVILRNVLKAKFERILRPIGERVLPADQAAKVAFDAFLAETLHHELSHGLGPGRITVGGRESEVRLELKDLYSTLEEAKADVMGVYNILALIEKGVIPASLREALEPTFVAGLFRSARFGLHEAHGRGVVAQFNYLLEKGALEIDEQGRFRAVSARFPTGIRELLAEMLMLQATGDYPGTAKFLDTYGVASPALEAAVSRLSDVAVDIRPVYEQAEALLP